MERDEAALRQLNAFADTPTASYNAKVEMQEVMLKSQELMREVVWLGGGPHFQAASHGGARDERGGGARARTATPTSTGCSRRARRSTTTTRASRCSAAARARARAHAGGAACAARPARSRAT